MGSDLGCEVMANVLDGFGDEEGLKCFFYVAYLQITNELSRGEKPAFPA